ncbi:C2H2-type domain-containing protein [Aphis craccivora]|uniref:C2H2-type domain-containing protein n=1 Tax=Aphis craccivora TaxID=307492 RepID=A0A6G0YYS5_APHCR|nr:C2H2-type domain-containing protein [Aphis craccivora]
MSKNPFVNCKSRKRRKIRIPVPRPQVKLFCPRSMVRYDNSPSGYNTIWACKMCLLCLLSEDAVRNHLINCNDSIKKIPSNPPTKKNDDIYHYICDTCNKIFSRHVILKKHLEEHVKSSVDLESEQSDNDTADMGKDVKID